MSDAAVTMTDIEAERLTWVNEHKNTYIRSGGTQGHIVDLREIGGLRFTTHLLLETVGRKTRERRIVPLIYGNTGGEVVIVASKGGADIDPAWYLNLKASHEVSLQIATAAYRATWREPLVGERSRVWDYMEQLYPPYAEYRAATTRQIPLVLLCITTPIPVFQ